MACYYAKDKVENNEEAQQPTASTQHVTASTVGLQPAVAAEDFNLTVADQEKTDKYYGEGTLCRTMFEQVDWSLPSITIFHLLRWEVFVCPITCALAQFHPAWIGYNLFDLMFLTSNVIRGAQACLTTLPPLLMLFHWGYCGAFGLFWLTFILLFGFGQVMDNRGLGIAVEFFLMLCFCAILVCVKKMPWWRFRYYLAWCMYNIIVNVGTFIMLSTVIVTMTPKLIEATNQFIGSLFLPAVASFYDLAAFQIFMRVNRCFMCSGIPMAIPSMSIYMVRSWAINMRIASFLPRLGLPAGDLARAVLGSFCSSFCSGAVERCFGVQRLKHIITGGRGPCKINPEMDSFVRSKSSISYMCLVHYYLVFAIVLPGGAPWLQDPKVWLCPLAFIASELLTELLVVTLHRNKYPIQGESWWATRTRLTKTFQLWPNLQADEGERYRRRAAEAKGEAYGTSEDTVRSVASYEVSPSDARTLGVLQAKRFQWSKHPFFTDFRISCIIFMAQGVNLIYVTPYLYYGTCRYWYPPGHPGYADEPTCV